MAVDWVADDGTSVYYKCKDCLRIVPAKFCETDGDTYLCQRCVAAGLECGDGGP